MGVEYGESEGDKMLVENTLFGTRDNVQIAIDRLKEFEPEEGYYLAFSGGKDSCVILDLAKKAKVKFDAHHNLTTVDPPELIYFIRKYYSDVAIKRSKKTMWQLIEGRGFPPTRMIRYCCSELKEGGGKGRLVVTGVRWAESKRRSGRQMVEMCRTDPTQRFIHPIIDWSDEDIWEYIHQQKIPYCSLYDEGFKRLGCVICPLSGSENMKRDAERWPKYKENYIAAFDRGIKKAIARGRTPGQKTGQEMYEWWVSGNATKKDDPYQQRFFFE